MYSLSKSNCSGLHGTSCHIIALPPGPPADSPLLRVKGRAHSGRTGPAGAPVPLPSRGLTLAPASRPLPAFMNAQACFSGPAPFARKLPQNAGSQTFHTILLDLDKQVGLKTFACWQVTLLLSRRPLASLSSIQLFSLQSWVFISSSQVWNVSLITGESNYHSF